MKLLAVFIFFISLNNLAQRTQCPILPTPITYQPDGQKSILEKEIYVDFTHLPTPSKAAFIHELTQLYHLNVVESTSPDALRFEKLTNVQKDSYSISYSNDNKVISFSSDASAFHAVNSFVQLISFDGNYLLIDHAFVYDAPRFDWRGLHLDVSRHFFTVDEVKRYIDLMALYKFNTFHWHLTDDQGWRIEIKKYPLLTEIGAWRDSTVVGHFSNAPRVYEKAKYGGFYTQEEVKEIVRYAGTKYITVVPEIELPGHSRAALAAYPHLSCTGEQLPVPGLWGVFDDIYCTKDASIDFLKEVLQEVIQLFPSEYIHIGGDEAPKTRWNECTACKKVIADNKLQDEHALQSYFIQQMDAFLTSKGKKIIGWDEILEGGLSPNASVMSWRGTAGGVAAARQKHYVVVTPMSNCYFDYYQSGHAVEPLAIGGYLPLEKVYAFDPVPSELTAEEATYILGGQANLWTEYIPSMQQLEYMTYPRAIALAQSLWCFDKIDYNNFLQVYLGRHETYLEQHGVNFARSVHLPSMSKQRMEKGIVFQIKGARESDQLYVKQSVSDSSWSGLEGFVLSGKDSVMLFRPNSTDGADYEYKVSANAFDGEVAYVFEAHGTLGLPVEITPSPDKKYNHNGSLNLVDGVHGELPWKGNEWLGFQSGDIELIVSLDKKRMVDGVNIGFLDDNGSWIYLPEILDVYISKNKRKWRKIAGLAVNAQPSMRCEVSARGKKKKAMYLKVIVHPMAQIPDGMPGAGNLLWTFIDEVKISYCDKK